MIVNYASSSINKLKASLNDDTRVIIYDGHIFIVHATVLKIASVLSQNSPTIHRTEQHILDTNAGKQLS